MNTAGGAQGGRTLRGIMNSPSGPALLCGNACLTAGWGTLQSTYNLQFEARIAQRQSLVKQLHERQLDLLITTESPKMDELSSQPLGNFTLALYCASPAKQK
jgi:DNA-binding transcriptional LysR family regulator